MPTESAGPLLAAGALTLANQTVLARQKPTADEYFETIARIGVATGIGVGALTLIEKASRNLAVGLAWTGLITTLFVRYRNQPTVIERTAKFLGG